jgi:hypothetical protein
VLSGHLFSECSAVEEGEEEKDKRGIDIVYVDGERWGERCRNELQVKTGTEKNAERRSQRSREELGQEEPRKAKYDSTGEFEVGMRKERREACDRADAPSMHLSACQQTGAEASKSKARPGNDKYPVISTASTRVEVLPPK